MAQDNLTILYNSIKSDYDTGTEADFRRHMLMPGKAGYENRRQLFKMLQQDNWDVGNTYEEFRDRIGLVPKQRANQRAGINPAPTGDESNGRADMKTPQNSRAGMKPAPTETGGNKDTPKSDRFRGPRESRPYEGNQAGQIVQQGQIVHNRQEGNIRTNQPIHTTSAPSAPNAPNAPNAHSAQEEAPIYAQKLVKTAIRDLYQTLTGKSTQQDRQNYLSWLKELDGGDGEQTEAQREQRKKDFWDNTYSALKEKGYALQGIDNGTKLRQYFDVPVSGINAGQLSGEDEHGHPVTTQDKLFSDGSIWVKFINQPDEGGVHIPYSEAFQTVKDAQGNITGYTLNRSFFGDRAHNALYGNPADQIMIARIHEAPLSQEQQTQVLRSPDWQKNFYADKEGRLHNVDWVSGRQVLQDNTLANLTEADIKVLNEQERLRTVFLQRKIDEAQAEKKSLLEKWNKLKDVGPELMTDWMRSNYSRLTPEQRQQADDYQALSAAIDKVNERLKLLSAAQKNPHSSAWSNFWRGAGNAATDKQNWFGGASSWLASNSFLHIQNKLNEGKPLSKAEESLLAQEGKSNSDQQRWSGQLGDAYAMGITTAASVPFMLEFAMTDGLSGIGNAVASTTSKGLNRLAAKAVKTGIVSATRKSTLQTIAKNTGIAAGDFISSVAMASSIGLPRTIADITNRHLGEVKQQPDGSYRFANGMSWGKAIWQGLMANTTENLTEKAGAHMRLGEWAEDYLKSLGANKAAKFVSWLGSNKYMERAGLQDLPSEGTEEELGIVLNSLLVGDNSLSDLVDAQQQFQLWGSIALSLGLTKGVTSIPEGYSLLQSARYKNKTNKADHAAAAAIGNKWANLKKQIDDTPNAKLPDLARMIVASKQLDKDQKRAAMNYAQNLLTYRGFNIGSSLAEAQANAKTYSVSGRTTAKNDNFYQDQNGNIDLASIPQEIFDKIKRTPAPFRLTVSMINHVLSRHGKELGITSAQEAIDFVVGVMTNFDHVRQANDGALVFSIEDGHVKTGSRAISILIDQTGDGFYGIKTAGYEAIKGLKKRPVLWERGADESSATDAASASVTTGLSPTSDGEQSGSASLQSASDTANLDNSGETEENEGGISENSDNSIPPSIESIAVARAALAPSTASTLDRLMSEGAPEGQIEDVMNGLGAEEAAAAQAYISGRQQLFSAISAAADENGQITVATYEGRSVIVRNQDAATGMAVLSDGRSVSIDDLENPATIATTEAINAISQQIEAGGNQTGTSGHNMQNGQSMHNGQESGQNSRETGGHEDPPLQGNNNAPIISQETGENGQENDSMPMLKNGEPDFGKATPERAYAYIYNNEESGLSSQEADDLVKVKQKNAQKRLEAARKAKAPKFGDRHIGDSIARLKAAQQKHRDAIASAQAEVDYWERVKQIADEAHAEAFAQQRAQQRAEQRADMKTPQNSRKAANFGGPMNPAPTSDESNGRAEQRAGMNPAPTGDGVGGNIITKWNEAEKIEGNKDEITLQNGEVVRGHYVLVESGAATPSHDANNNFHQSEGFPVDVNGHTVNDRDYEGDKEAQQDTRDMADQYDSRAVAPPPVVSNLGVVLSGNGRTMAGELAAQQGTDTAYINYLKAYGGKFGFSEEQVADMQHPRVLFVLDEDMPYTTDTFAKFNAPDKKTQSNTERAVKMGKLVDDRTYARVADMVNGFDTLGEFYSDDRAAAAVVGELNAIGVINDKNMPELFNGNRLSERGKELIESVLIGKAFEGHPETVRQLLEFPAMRQKVVVALKAINDNVTRCGQYSLMDELADAINLVSEARRSGYTAQDTPSELSRQQNLFPDEMGQTVADWRNLTVLMLSEVMNDGRTTQLKKVLNAYNAQAVTAASGQVDVWAQRPRTKEEILTDIINTYGTDKQKDALERARQFKRAGLTDNATNTGDADGNSTGQSGDAGGSDNTTAHAPAAERAGGTDTENSSGRQQGDLAQGEGGISLSQEKDEKGSPFVVSKNGTIDFGTIDQSQAKGISTNVAAPIRLSYGNQDYGYVHMQKHIDQLKQNGYNSVEEFAEAVASGKNEIRQGNVYTDETTGEVKETYLLVMKGEKGSVLYVELVPSGNYYTINSGGVFKNSYIEKRKELWSASTEHSATSGEPQDFPSAQNKPESDDVSALSQSPSDGKGTTLSSDTKQIEGKKSDKEDERAEQTDGRADMKSAPTGDNKGDRSDRSNRSNRSDRTGTSGQNGQNRQSGQEKNDPQPVGQGDFGPVYDQFRGKPKEAIALLSRKKSGEALGALHHKDVGDIDLVWGKEGTGHSDGYGLAKLVKYHHEVLDNLQAVLDDMHVVKKSDNRVQLESDTHQASIRLTWNEKKKTWLLTAFEKKNSVLDNTTDTAKTTIDGKRNDTATPLNTVSEGKSTNSATNGKGSGKISDFGQKIGGSRKDLAQEALELLDKKSEKDIATAKKADEIFSKKHIEHLKEQGLMSAEAARILHSANVITDRLLAKLKKLADGEEISGVVANTYAHLVKQWQGGGLSFDTITAEDLASHLTNYFEAHCPDTLSTINRLYSEDFISRWLPAVIDTYAEVEGEGRGNLQYAVRRHQNGIVSRWWVIRIGSMSGYSFSTREEAFKYLRSLCPVKEKKQGKEKSTATNENSAHLKVVAKGAGYRIKSTRINGDIYFSGVFYSKEAAEAYLKENGRALSMMEEAYAGLLGTASVLQVEREGIDYRQGRDVSEQDFLDQFGFRGVEFGNWVTQKERQPYLNTTYDALMDLSSVIGISPRALSLVGRLGLSFGGRGRGGKAVAHYEPGYEVINLTRTQGAGSLAHEWFHAVDNYLARSKSGNTTDYSTERRGRIDGMREELSKAFDELVEVIKSSDFHKRSQRAGTGYWGTITEEAARAFSLYVEDKIEEKSGVSPMLTRRVDDPRSIAASSAEKDAATEASRNWPYPTTEERQEINKAFDRLFDTIQEKTDPTGNVILFHRTASAEVSPVSEEQQAIVGGMAQWLNEAGIDTSVSEQEGQAVLDLQRQMEESRLRENKKAPETGRLASHETPPLSPAVSDADAKIRQNLQTLAQQLDESNKTDTKSFISSLAKALGIPADLFKGKSSRYVTIEAKNGQVVTLRVSNHNADVRNFDNRSEAEGVSLVISSRPNNGIKDNGSAHIVEFFYADKALKKAEGKPLAAIVRSVEQMLYSGEYRDTTGLAQRQEVNVPLSKIREMRGYHGSGADFERFDHSHMSEGEGAQAHGWGTYVARKKETSMPYISGVNGTGVLYTVEIPDKNGRNYIEEDKTYKAGDKEVQAVKDTLYEKLIWDEEGVYASEWSRKELKKEMDADFAGDMTGAELYGNLYTYLGGDEEASMFLNSMGYKGIHYYGQRDGDCYVIFNENDLKITDKVKFFRSPRGEVLGFTVGGRIYIDPTKARPETPLHEYGHIWLEALKQGNRKEYDRLMADVMSNAKLTPIWEEVRSSYSDHTGEEMAEEVFVMYSGRKGAARIQEEVNRVAHDEGMSLRDKATTITALHRLRKAIANAWKSILDFLHIHYKDADEAADQVLKDFLGQNNPMEALGTDRGNRSDQSNRSDQTGTSRQNMHNGQSRQNTVYRGGGLEFSKDPAVQENIENGLDALSLLANGEEEVVDAMRREELSGLGGTAEIAFIWGTPGHLTSTGRYKGGEGFQKIIEKHGIDDAIKVVETIAKGEIGKPYGVERGQRVDINLKDHHTTVSLFRNGESKSWVLTGYTIDRNTDAKGRGSDLHPATQNDPIRTRAELGAALQSVANVRRIFGIDESDRKENGNRSDQSNRSDQTGTKSDIRYQFLGEKGAAALDQAEEHQANSDDGLLFRNTNRRVFGGNSGYAGYSKSNRALAAEERGLRNVSQMDKDFANVVNSLLDVVPGHTTVKLSDIRNEIKNISADEWHHTSMYGNKTNYYSAKTIADYFAAKQSEEWQQKWNAKQSAYRTEYENTIEKRDAVLKEINEVEQEIQSLRKVIDTARKNLFKTYPVANSQGNIKEKSLFESRKQDGVYYEEGDGRVGSDAVYALSDNAEERHKGILRRIKGSGKSYGPTAEIKTSIKDELADAAFGNIPQSDQDRWNELQEKRHRLSDAISKADLEVEQAEIKFRLGDAVHPFEERQRAAVENNEAGGRQAGGYETRPYEEKSEERADEGFALAGKRADNTASGLIRPYEGNDNTGGQRQKEAASVGTIREAAEAAAERLGVKITIVHSADISDADAERQRLKREAKGWFDTQTGQIVLVEDNHTDSADAIATVLHEGVAHYGLRQIVGKENMDAFLKEVWREVDGETCRRISALALEKGFDLNRATEEYMASIAERTDFEKMSSPLRRVWEAVKRAFRHLLDRLGIKDYRLTDGDLRYILWSSYQNLLHGQRATTLVDMAKDAAMRWRTGVGMNRQNGHIMQNGHREEDVEQVNKRFNEDIERYERGEMSSNEYISVGYPQGDISAFMPSKPIIMRQKVLKKALKKHGLDLDSIKDLPSALAHPIFIFKSSPKTLSVLTELQARNGKNVFVAMELDVTKQMGHQFLEVNDILSVHDREEENIIYPIVENETLAWVDKEKGLRWLSSAKSNSQAIAKEILEAAKIVRDFENPKLPAEENDNRADMKTPQNSRAGMKPAPTAGGNEDTLLFRRSNSHNVGIAPTEGSNRARDTYNYDTTQNSAFSRREAMQDSMLGLKKLQDAIAEQTGTPVKDYENAYMQENSMSSRNLTQMNEYVRKRFRPLLEAISKLEQEGAEYDDVMEYMLAKHGVERQRELSVREALTDKDGNLDTQRLAQWEQRKQAVLADPANRTWTEQQGALDYVAQHEFGANLVAQDYAGLTGWAAAQLGPNQKKPDMQTAMNMAYQRIPRFEREHPKTADALWEAVNAATKETLKTSYEGGLMTKEAYKNVAEMYQYYVPMRGWADTTSDKVYDYLEHARSRTNSTLKTARGRSSMADDPVATIANMAQSTIVEANRNRMKQSFLNLVLNRPTSLVSVSKLWARYDDVDRKWVPLFPDFSSLPEDAGGEEKKVEVIKIQKPPLSYQLIAIVAV